MTEAEFIAALRRLPLHPAARSLNDDTALLDTWLLLARSALRADEEAVRRWSNAAALVRFDVDTFLVLDHEEEDGADLRPHLPGPDGDLTAMLNGFVAGTPLSDLLVPLTLDPLTVHDDAHFVDTLAAEKNLPKEVADHVPDLF